MIFKLNKVSGTCKNIVLGCVCVFLFVCDSSTQRQIVKTHSKLLYVYFVSHYRDKDFFT